jgi:hypothetical protein
VWRARKHVYCTHDTVRVLQSRNATLQSFDAVNQDTEEVFEARTSRLRYIRKEGLILHGCLLWVSIVSFLPVDSIGWSYSGARLEYIDERQDRVRHWE